MVDEGHKVFRYLFCANKFQIYAISTNHYLKQIVEGCKDSVIAWSNLVEEGEDPYWPCGKSSIELVDKQLK